MTTTRDHPPPAGIHPLHAVLLAGAAPLFLGGLLSDIAYARSPEPQWTNFAQWLLAGAMVFAGFALLWSLVDVLRHRTRPRWALACLLLLAAVFVLGFIDSFVHTRDAYGSMPTGLVLSVIVALLAAAATWAGFSSLGKGAAS